VVDYGQDAPGVVRGLLLAALLCAAAGLIGPAIGSTRWVRPSSLFMPSVCLWAVGGWMIWSSQVGKWRKVRALLDGHR
jgi:hypothetical protein